MHPEYIEEHLIRVVHLFRLDFASTVGNMRIVLNLFFFQRDLIYRPSNSVTTLSDFSCECYVLKMPIFYVCAIEASEHFIRCLPTLNSATSVTCHKKNNLIVSKQSMIVLTYHIKLRNLEIALGV